MNEEIRNDSMVLVNIVELASELAHEKLEEIMGNDAEKIYVSTTDCITFYTDEAQDIFNELYDEYYELILTCQ